MHQWGHDDRYGNPAGSYDPGPDPQYHIEEHTLTWKGMEFQVMVEAQILSHTPATLDDPAETEIASPATMKSIKCEGLSDAYFGRLAIKFMLENDGLLEYLQDMTVSEFSQGYTEIL